MPNVELIISVPALLADRLTADASHAHLPVEQHAARVLMAEVLRRDAERHAAWATQHPQAHAREQRDTVADEIERDVARLVDDGLDPADGTALAARLLAEYDQTQTPGYLDPGNTALPMTAERHIAILRATLRADHDQHIAELESRAADAGAAGNEPARSRYLAQARRLREIPLP